ncbi:hypothetical protein GGI07_001431 [Coemansia sp. Benny D115]|nr:hypothetical protein GGI07_001431 [Coemansia sp. Benny D115]
MSTLGDLTNSSTAQELLELRASQTAACYLASCTTTPIPHRVVVGAAIAGTGSNNPSVLIVQRSADERSYSNEWEIPGGHVDPGESILDAVTREVFEETALKVTEVISEFEGFEYWSTKYEEGDSDDVNDKVMSVCTKQLNFCVRVQDVSRVVLNSEEHQKYAWCTAQSIDEYQMTPTMKKVVLDALDAFKAAEN